MHVLVVLLTLVVGVCVASPAPYGYHISSLKETDYGYTGSLLLFGSGPYGGTIKNLTLNVYFQTQDILRIKITDANKDRWEVPLVNRLPLPKSKPQNQNYKITFTQNPSPFGFAITRVKNGDVLFNTTSSLFAPLIFEDQFISFGTVLPQNPYIYGLGERMTSLRLPIGNNFTIWAIDHAMPAIENLYGSFPFYLEMRPSGLAHGAFFLNSNAQEFELQKNYLQYRTIGGIIDMFFFTGAQPADVVQQYNMVVGNPALPPYWALGWHQCRWGYSTLNDVKYVVRNYSLHHIPLDTIWNDIDYMDSYRDFTNDPVRYPQQDVRQFVKELHSNGQHYIMIIDPGISIRPGYATFDDLVKSRAYIKQDGTESPVRGKVWPGDVYFPDFFHPNASDFWYTQIANFHSQGPEFDGMWIDMNEISNFCDGECKGSSVGAVGNRLSSFPDANLDFPPYVPGGVPLYVKTINMTANQYISYVYNTHNLYGFSEGIVTSNALEKLRGTRAVVISRSTFAGTGSRHGHWTGDNYSNYGSLAYSVPSILALQMFGVNFVGADICGFGGDTTEQLCSRWMQLGTLYPFARNHNSVGQRPQEPYAFGPTLLNISIAALNRRYTLLPYFYTLFAGAHFRAEMMWRPLFFEFPNDVNTFGIDAQFMIGSALLVSPVLAENAVTVVAYFPEAVWYSYYDGTSLVSSGKFDTLSAPLDFIPIHVRGGSIIPTQAPALTTTAARQNPFSLLVALDTNGDAQGEIYLDDGESLNPTEGNSTVVEFVAQRVSSGAGGSITSAIIHSGYAPSSLPKLSTVTVFGVPQSPHKVIANNQPASFTYNPQTHVLSITQLSLSMLAKFSIDWA